MTLRTAGALPVGTDLSCSTEAGPWRPLLLYQGAIIPLVIGSWRAPWGPGRGGAAIAKTAGGSGRRAAVDRMLQTEAPRPSNSVPVSVRPSECWGCI